MKNSNKNIRKFRHRPSISFVKADIYDFQAEKLRRRKPSTRKSSELWNRRENFSVIEVLKFYRDCLLNSPLQTAIGFLIGLIFFFILFYLSALLG